MGLNIFFCEDRVDELFTEGLLIFAAAVEEKKVQKFFPFLIHFVLRHEAFKGSVVLCRKEITSILPFGGDLRKDASDFLFEFKVVLLNEGNNSQDFFDVEESYLGCIMILFDTPLDRAQRV